MKPDFEYLISDNCFKAQIGSIIGLVVLLALAAFFIGFGIAIPFAPILVIGLIPLLGIALVAVRFRGDLLGSAYWLREIENNPQNIIWIKPVITRHTVGYVFTLYKEHHFQLCSVNGTKIAIKCSGLEDKKTFINGVLAHLSHAQLGYSKKIENLYESNHQQFLNNLKAQGLFTSIASFNV